MSEERDGMSPYGEHDDLGVIDDEYFVADLRAVFERPAAPEVADRHLTAMREVARDLLPPVAAEGVEAPFWTWPRRLGAAVAALAVAVLGLGGLGMAGALPGPVQDFVATVGDHIGLDVPKADGTVPGHRSTSGDTATTTSSGSAPGQTGSTPGQSGETPANGAEAPGQAGTTPGQSGTAPGQVDNPSATAPGQVGNPGATAPGKVDNPSATAPGQAGAGNPNAGSGNNSGNAYAGSGNNNAGGNGKGATTTTRP